MKKYDFDASQVGRANIYPKASELIAQRNTEVKKSILTDRGSAHGVHTLRTSLSGGSQADSIGRKITSSPSEGQQLLLKMQRVYGNQYTQRVMDLARKGQGGTEVGAEVEQAITSKRGGGQALDQSVQGQMESAFNADFSGVRVHTDRESDGLNRELNARAFTTGQDVFFREGAYNPGSSSGRELLAHELTHVVQQTDGLHKKMTLGQPGDIYEQEADEAARAVMQQEQRATSTGSGKGKTQRQPEEEEKETLATKPREVALQRQAEPKEEEELQTKQEPGRLRRQEEPEEEEISASAKSEVSGINRQAEEKEEEAISAKPETDGLRRQKEEEKETTGL